MSKPKTKSDWVVVLVLPSGECYVWSKYQNSYFWGGLGNYIRLYTRVYAQSLVTKVGFKVKAISLREFEVAWRHKLTGKDLFSGYKIA